MHSTLSLYGCMRIPTIWCRNDISHASVSLLHAWMLVLLALSKCIPATYESVRCDCMNRSLFKPLYRIKPRVVSYPHPRRLSSPRHRMMLPRITDSHPRPHTGWPPLQPPLPFKIPGWILWARALATDDSEYFNLYTAFWCLYIYIWIWITDKKIMWEIEDCSCASWSSSELSSTGLGCSIRERIVLLNRLNDSIEPIWKATNKSFWAGFAVCLSAYGNLVLKIKEFWKKLRLLIIRVLQQ